MAHKKQDQHIQNTMVSPYEGHNHKTSIGDKLGLDWYSIHHSDAGLNPITDAAAPLFAMLGRIQSFSNYKKLHQLQKELSKEIHSFQTNAKNKGYNAEQILIARYALCASCDDIINRQPWGNKGLWDSYSLLNVFHPDHAMPERFFIILERLSKEPALFIDILELMYLCLMLGFLGPDRLQVGENEYLPNKQLLEITEELYQTIRAYRGDCNKLLSPINIKEIRYSPVISKFFLSKALWCSWTLLAVIFFGLNGAVISKFKYINSQLNKITVKMQDYNHD